MEQKVFPKVIMHMKIRFQKSENYPLSLDEILDELNIYDVPKKIRDNLDNMILPKNPKLDMTLDDKTRKYTYKPSFVLKNRRDLINLIKTTQAKGEGGVLKDDVQESMTTEDFERIFKVKKKNLRMCVSFNRNEFIY